MFSKKINSLFYMVMILALLPLSAFASDTDQFIGIGVTLDEAKDKGVYIDYVFENSPAEKAGLMFKDQILAVDGRSTQDKKLKEVLKWVRGPQGASVDLTIGRANSTLNFKIVRDVVTVNCFMKGNLNLNFSGTVNNGSLWGIIGSQHVNWFVNSGLVRGTYKDEQVSLNMEQWGTSEFKVHGWIHNTYVTWTGYNHYMNYYQSCIF